MSSGKSEYREEVKRSLQEDLEKEADVDLEGKHGKGSSGDGWPRIGVDQKPTEGGTMIEDKGVLRKLMEGHDDRGQGHPSEAHGGRHNDRGRGHFFRSSWRVA